MRKEEAKRWMGVRSGPSSDGTISAPRAAVTGRGEEPSSRTGQGVRSLPPGQVRGCGAFLQDSSGTQCVQNKRVKCKKGQRTGPR